MFANKAFGDHFAARPKSFRDSGLRGAERKAKEKEAWATLKAKGYKPEEFFFFNPKDEASKARAKMMCETYAKGVAAKTGVAMAVNEGCFL